MDNRVALLVAAVLVMLAGIGIWVARRRIRSRPCAGCGGTALHGYSKAAESDPKDIVPLCHSCLFARLNEDYSKYTKRAVVVQPVAELPCYVFRPKNEWDDNLRRELESVLVKLGSKCNSCGDSPHYVWFDCALDPGTVADLPNRGLSQTLLPGGTSGPIPLCGKCAATRIAQSFEKTEERYLEVCGPHGTEDGLVTTMAY